jgi:hypothetical protein
VTQTPTPVSLVFRTVAAVAPGLPSTGAGAARRAGTLGALAAAGPGAAALGALASRKTALAAEELVPSEGEDSR